MSMNPNCHHCDVQDAEHVLCEDCQTKMLVSEVRPMRERAEKAEARVAELETAILRHDAAREGNGERTDITYACLYRLVKHLPPYVREGDSVSEERGLTPLQKKLLSLPKDQPQEPRGSRPDKTTAGNGIGRSTVAGQPGDGEVGNPGGDVDPLEVSEGARGKRAGDEPDHAGSNPARGVDHRSHYDDYDYREHLGEDDMGQ